MTKQPSDHKPEAAADATEETPFFARFLEGQLGDEDLNEVAGGGRTGQTLKFPSDKDEGFAV